MKSFLIFFVIILFSAGCASTKLQESLGKTWRTGAPENAILGGYGIRTVTRDGIVFSENGQIDLDKLKTSTTKSRTVKYDSEKEVKAEVSKETIGKLNLSYTDVAKKGYKVIITKVTNTKEIANNLVGSDKNLDEQYLSSKSFRFITGIARVYDYKSTEDINISAGTSLDAAKKINGTITGEGKSGKKIELKYEDGATVAYTYARICWNPDGTIRNLQDEAPNPWYMFWFNTFDCPQGSLETKPK